VAKADDERVMQAMVEAMVNIPVGKIQAIPAIMGQFLIMPRESLVTWAGKPQEVMAAQFMAYLKGHGQLTEVLEMQYDSGFKVMTDVVALCPAKSLSKVDGGSH